MGLAMGTTINAVALSALLVTLSPAALAQWQYHVSKDEMRGTSSHRAVLLSETEHRFRSPYDGGSRMFLQVQASRPDVPPDVVIGVTKGQFVCSASGCRWMMKLGERLETISLYQTASYASNMLFVGSQDRGKVMLAIRAGETIIVEAVFYQDGARQFKFAPAGLTWPPK